MKSIKNLNCFVRSLRSFGFKVVAYYSSDTHNRVRIEYPYDFLIRIPGYSYRDLFYDFYLKNHRLSGLYCYPSSDRKYLYLEVTFVD